MKTSIINASQTEHIDTQSQEDKCRNGPIHIIPSPHSLLYSAVLASSIQQNDHYINTYTCAHTHTHILFQTLPLQVITRHWVACPVWRSRLLLLFPYFIHSDVYMGSWLFKTPYTVARQAPLSTGILQAGILKWVATPSSRGSSRPREQTQASCISDIFFNIWATREAQYIVTCIH